MTPDNMTPELLRRGELVDVLIDEAGYDNVPSCLAPYGLYDDDGRCIYHTADRTEMVLTVARDYWDTAFRVRRFCAD